jgi:MFS family permease
VSDTNPAQPAGSRISRKEWRVIILSSLGGALEFYDFVVYAMFAQYIGQAFFPSDNPLTSLMLSFATFAVGYLARPIGGMVLGHFGDKFGRRKVFIVSIFVMSLSTLGMGLLPTYATIGVSASVCMVLLRLLQGFCLGGELPGAITYVVETAPRRATFAAGVIFFCVNTGVAVGSGLNAGLQHLLTPDQMHDFGWRIAFLIGGGFGMISFYLRLSLEESKAFMKKAHIRPAMPMMDLIKKHPTTIFVGIAAIAATSAYNGYLFAVSSFFPETMGYDPGVAANGQLIALLILSFGLVFVAWLGDRIARRKLLAVGALILLLGAWPFYAAAQAHSVNFYVLMVIAGLTGSLFNGVFAGILGDLYPARVRFSGIAASMNISLTVFSGFAPLVATWLTATVGVGDVRYASLFLIGCAVLALIGAWLLPKHQGWAMADAGLPNDGPNKPARPLETWQEAVEGAAE